MDRDRLLGGREETRESEQPLSSGVATCTLEREDWRYPAVMQARIESTEVEGGRRLDTLTVFVANPKRHNGNRVLVALPGEEATVVSDRVAHGSWETITLGGVEVGDGERIGVRMVAALEGAERWGCTLTFRA